MYIFYLCIFCIFIYTCHFLPRLYLSLSSPSSPAIQYLFSINLPKRPISLFPFTLSYFQYFPISPPSLFPLSFSLCSPPFPSLTLLDVFSSTHFLLSPPSLSLDVVSSHFLPQKLLYSPPLSALTVSNISSSTHFLLCPVSLSLGCRLFSLSLK